MNKENIAQEINSIGFTIRCLSDSVMLISKQLSDLEEHIRNNTNPKRIINTHTSKEVKEWNKKLKAKNIIRQ